VTPNLTEDRSLPLGSINTPANRREPFRLRRDSLRHPRALERSRQRVVGWRIVKVRFRPIADIDSRVLADESDGARPGILWNGWVDPEAANIDAYIAASPLAAQPALRRIREIARAAAPDAKEAISYRMPALRGRGILVYFAAFKTHIGLFPPVRGDPRLDRDLARYRGPKGNLRFPLDEPMPYDLIERILRLRAEQDQAPTRRKRTQRPSA
jgi:uncharacterized protein YdhG (YjbR/CyaY superfamily)